MSEPSAGDISKLAMWIHERAGDVYGSRDQYGFTWEPARIALRYSRMKWGTTAPGWSAIALWFTSLVAGGVDIIEREETQPESRMGCVLRAIADAARGYFNDDDSPIEPIRLPCENPSNLPPS